MDLSALPSTDDLSDSIEGDYIVKSIGEYTANGLTREQLFLTCE